MVELVIVGATNFFKVHLFERQLLLLYLARLNDNVLGRELLYFYFGQRGLLLSQDPWWPTLLDRWDSVDLEDRSLMAARIISVHSFLFVLNYNIKSLSK